LLKRLLVLLVLISSGILVFTPLSKPKAKSDAAAPSAQRPKLILMIIIDQFPYKYLARFRPFFVEGGFNLLLGGANFIDCRYDDAITATCPGHAALSTGAYPDVNGIIGNEWYDRALHRAVNCVEDGSTRMLGGAEGVGKSPARLIGDTFSDELRLESDFRSRVISISLKDRGAIIPGGHTANAAYWYDVSTGHFVTSSYYMQTLPAWATKFNDQNPAKAYCSKSWQALPETPGTGGKTLEEFSSEPHETCPDRRFLEWLNDTPAMSEIQLDFARQALREEHLGQGPATDMLAISLSENDHVGHKFGPYSPQVADMTLRTDRDLAAFFKDLDQTVGLDNVWIALSADHGVAPSPRFIEEHHLGAGRADPAGIAAAVNQALSNEFGPGDWIEAGAEFQLYLNHAGLEKRGINLGRAEFAAAEAAAAQPQVAAAFTRSQIMTGNLPDTPIARKVAHSFNSLRGGDVYVVLEPYAVPIESHTGSTHGSPWTYDAQVPLVFWGSAFKAGMYGIPTQPIDLPATLAVAMGLGQPSVSQGRPLTMALK
jgi:predicted AlkP superfamily pyrophosphatase or phosphodiesterase